MTTTRVTTGDLVHCIQIGHYGPHPAAGDCLCIDDAGRCYSPKPATPTAPCSHHYADGSPLVCNRPDPHEPGRGCTYASTTGSHTNAEPY